jgi:hypothetical protein
VTKQSTETVAASSPTWETLEAFARPGMQQLLQRTLEAEGDCGSGGHQTTPINPKIFSCFHGPLLGVYWHDSA